MRLSTALQNLKKKRKIGLRSGDFNILFMAVWLDQPKMLQMNNNSVFQIDKTQIAYSEDLQNSV